MSSIERKLHSDIIPKNQFTTLIEGTITSIDLHKDNTRLVAAGRKAFYIYTVEDGFFLEEEDMRQSINTDPSNLNYSFNSVAWSNRDDYILATAATNGTIVMWNLNNQNRSKQDRMFSDHKRTVNRVGFHLTEPWLISGSQDGTARLFDLRSKDASVSVFYSKTESVRDVKFSNHQVYTFAAVSENGAVQLWDVRRPDKYLLQFSAHCEPIYACDWHPSLQWFATCSRDKSIKIWDSVSTMKPSLKFQIHTLASVGKIKWRPQRKYQISSVAIAIDFNINIWDVRRPYIPFACFKGHADVPTDIVWRQDPRYVISCARDATIFLHDFTHSVKPTDFANVQALTANCNGEIAHAMRVIINTSPKSARISNILKRTVTPVEEFLQSNSVLNCYIPQVTDENCDDIPTLIQCALDYQLTGESVSVICSHNSGIAGQFGNHSAVLLWDVVGKVFGSPLQHWDDPYYKEDSDVDDTRERSKSLTPAVVSARMKKRRRLTKPEVATANMCVPELTLPQEVHRNERSREDVCVGDFIFGDRDMDPFGMCADDPEGLASVCMSLSEMAKNHYENSWIASKEPFSMRHEIPTKLPPIDCDLIMERSVTPNRNEESPVSVAHVDHNGLQLSIAHPVELPNWDFAPIIADALIYSVETGDLQTAISVLLALGEQRNILIGPELLDDKMLEHWTLEYLTILYKFRLWNKAAQVMQLSWIPEIYQKNQLTTIVRTGCPRCVNSLSKCGWTCDNCPPPLSTSRVSLCSVCHKVVKGLFSWCRVCTHGGHLHHLNDWFKNNSECPTGCGHLCEY